MAYVANYPNRRKPKLRVRRARMTSWEWRLTERPDGMTQVERRRHPKRGSSGKFDDPGWDWMATL
jgi:hypothetical protein